MKKTINIFLIIFSFAFLQNCEDEQFESSLMYVAFGDTTYSTGVDVGGSTTIDVTVYTSQKVSSDVSFNVVVDPSSNAAAESYSVPGSVTVPSGSNEGILTVALTDTNLGIGINKLVLKFDNVTAGFGNGGSTTVEYVQNCTEVTGTLDLTFDRWGSEVSWEIKDALGGTVASGGGYSDTASGTSTSDTIDITLCSGRTYTLITTDAYGDGWGAVGNYTLTIGGVVKVTGDSSLMDNGGTGSISATATFDTN